MRLLRRLGPVALALAALAGCGNERFEPRSLEVNPKQVGRTVTYPTPGVTVDLPGGFGVRRTASPGVFRATIGETFVSAFAYSRAEQLPRDDEELKTAQERLERTVKQRGSGYRRISARTTRVAGARAVELLGEQTLSQRKLRIRSLHIFKGEVEYVFEIAAPVRSFPRVDRVVSPAIRRTLKLTGQIKKRPARRPARR